MRALKSDLAKRLLADAGAREQLRQVAPVTGDATQAQAVVVLQRRNATIERYVPRVVPKAA